MAPRRKRTAASKSGETVVKKAKAEDPKTPVASVESEKESGEVNGAYVFIEHCKS
uniref:Uncharacterized protein n=2 Tax=Anopheles albimanus TaxID=7167 RepID=A0A8W7JBJ1_ANOAL